VKRRPVAYGIFVGFGFTIFSDVVLIDEILKPHAVNYPESVNFPLSVSGLMLVLLGTYMWRTCPSPLLEMASEA